MIVARYEVPGSQYRKTPSRRDGRSWRPSEHRRDAYDTLKLGDIPGARTVPSLKYHRRPACSLFFVEHVFHHFVPGYDRTVPPGHFATAFS